MKRTLILLCYLLFACTSCLHAQAKHSAKAISRALVKQSLITQSAVKSAAASAQKAGSLAFIRRLSPGKRELLVTNLLRENIKNLQKAIVVLQQYQQKYGYADFFERFISLYYEHHFGRPTPNMSAFFAKVNACKNPAFQKAVALRLEELAHNKQKFISQLWQGETLPFVRVVYLPELADLSAQSFRPQDLVYSCEINVAPGGFIPLGSGNEVSTFMLEGTPWHIAGFSAGLEYLPELYRFLITNGEYNAALNVIWDRSSQSLLVSSLDNTRQLRVSRHEYHIPHRLHLHLQYLAPMSFTNTEGKTVAENSLLNISFPIENEASNPRVAPKDWFITYPVQKFLKDPNVNVSYGRIF